MIDKVNKIYTRLESGDLDVVRTKHEAIAKELKLEIALYVKDGHTYQQAGNRFNVTDGIVGDSVKKHKAGKLTHG